MWDFIVNTFSNINYLAVIAAIISSWLLGGLWYNKLVFGSVYSQSDAGKMAPSRHPGKMFFIAFVMWTISALAFTFCLGQNPPLGLAIMVGALTGICFVSTSLAVNYVFSGRSFKVFLVDAGYHTLQFTIYGVIYGLWH